MKKEKLEEAVSLIPKERIGAVRSFGEMQAILPNSLRESEINFLEVYFRLQKRIVEGRMIKARTISDGLRKKTGWSEFEENHEDLLTIIDMAVRGNTNRLLPTHRMPDKVQKKI